MIIVDKMKFEIIPPKWFFPDKDDEIDYYEYKLRQFLILTKSLKAKNLEIPIWLINQGLNYSRCIRRLKNELG